MPALNIIATHDTVRNSGPSSSRPSGMLPNLLTASQMTKTTNALAVSTNSQPVLVMTQVSDLPDAVPRVVLLTRPQTTKATATAADTPKTSLSSPRPRCGSASTGTSSAGWGTTSSTGDDSASATRLRFWVGVVCS